MDLSGAYISYPISGSIEFIDCSGYQCLSNSNIPTTIPAPYTTMQSDSKTVSNQYTNATLPVPLSPLAGVLIREWDAMCALGEKGVTLTSTPPTTTSPISTIQGRLPYTNNDDVHLNEIRRRIVYSNSNHVFETPIENIDEMRSYLNPRNIWIPTESFLYYSVRLVNSIWSFISDTIMVTQKVGNGVWVAFQPETYYFFKDSAHPWDARRLTLSHAGSPHVELFYNADTRCFSRQENDGHLHHFPYLTAEIYHGNLALYDITSFTETLMWTAGDSDNPPSANHVLSAWTLSSGILLDPSLPLVLKVITEDGDESTIPLHIPIN